MLEYSLKDLKCFQNKKVFSNFLIIYLVPKNWPVVFTSHGNRWLGDFVRRYTRLLFVYI